MRKTKIQSSALRTIHAALAAALCLALMLPFAGLPAAAAQAPTGDGWSQPVNLSNSGSTTGPLVVVDDENVTHVIWYDEFAGYRYTSAGEDEVWSPPVGVGFPFGDFRPRLLVGPNNLIYAFWIDGRGILNSSRVFVRDFGKANSWEPRTPLAQNVLSFDATIDKDNVIHLAYITHTDLDLLPAGVYYRQIAPGGGWTIPKNLYASQYFRAMAAEQASLSVAAPDAINAGSGESEADSESETGIRNVLVAWDEPALHKVLMRRSPDGGENWEDPVVVDQPSVETGSARPFDLEATIWKDQFLLVWKRQMGESSCSIMYRVSGDALNWSAPGFIFDEGGCPTGSGFLAQREDLLIWQVSINNQVYLLAWDGSRWSEPQVQPELAGFLDPATARTLTLGCRDMFYQVEQNRLHVVGCDLDGSQDIWITRKTFAELEAWFPPPQSWIGPMEVAQAPFGISGLNIMAGPQGSIHALWAQPVAQNDAGTLHYSGWNGQAWTDPAPVLRPRGGKFNQLTAGISGAGDLMIIWQGDEACQIYFSRAPGSRAFSSVEWMDPALLPTPTGTCSSPALAAGPQETVFAAYTVAINEGRGVYLNRSPDGGRTWEPPVRVFDAQAAQWEMVDHPVIAFDGGRLHMLWRHGLLLDPAAGQGLGYAYSDDLGQTWSAADTSVKDRLRWAGLAAAGGAVYRVWQQAGAEYPVIVTQVSADGGQHWGQPVSIASFSDIIDSPSLLVDPAGRVNLVQLNRDYLNKVVLQHWIWYNQGWAAGDSLDIGENTGGVFETAGIVSEDNRPAVLFTAANIATGSQSLQAVIGAAQAESAPPQALPSTQATAIPAESAEAALSEQPPADEPAGPVETAPAEETQSPADPTDTPAAEPAIQEIPDEPDNAPSIWTGLILGIALAVVIVAGVFGFRIVQSKS